MRLALGGTGLVLGLAALIWVVGHWDKEAIMDWTDDASMTVFFAALAVLPAVGFPTTPFYILAGASFGVTVGLVGSAASLAVNLILCYWVAHSGLRRWLLAGLARTRYELPDFREKHAVRFTLLVKLAPGVPTFIKNYLIGLGGVPFRVYFTISFVVTMVYAGVFVVLGESVLDQDFETAGWALAALGVVAAGLWYARRRWLEKERDEESEEE